MKRLLSLFFIIIILSSGQDVFAVKNNYVIDSRINTPVATPLGYKFSKSVSFLGEKAGSIINPNDIYIDKNQNIYVADTGNNRILKLDTDLKLLKEFKMEKNKGFNEPQGVFVSDDGTIYVADTKNNRVVLMNQNGEYIKEIIKPDDELLGEDFEFSPRKVGVSSIGNIYAMKQQWLMSIGADNEFLGFIGATRTQGSFLTFFEELFLNKIQKMLRKKPEPPSCLNFTITDTDEIYITTVDRQNGELKQMNALGRNIYPKKSAFGLTSIVKDIVTNPIFTDLAVDRNGNIFLLDSASKRVYVYDSLGNNLLFFGSSKYGKGNIAIPSAIEVDNNEKIYIADTELNQISIFEPTKFINEVFSANAAYNNGDYDKAMKQWKNVAKSVGNYTLANMAIARSYLKENNYTEAMKYFRLAGDKTYYSVSLDNERSLFYRKYFVIVAPVFVLAFLVMIWLLIRYYRITKKIVEKY